MRVFSAFPLPDEVKQEIAPFINYGMSKYSNIKWVKPENIHITLFFFGELSAGDVSSIEEELSRLSEGFPPISAANRGLGQFPPKGAPRVVFSPLIEGEVECTRVYSAGYPLFNRKFELKGKRYTPHITLGRAKRGKNPGFPREDEFFIKLNGFFEIERIILFESVLQSDGPVYNELSSFKLQR